MFPFVNSQYFQNILESFASAVVIFNSQGRAYALNEQATHMVGKSKDDCLGQSWEVLFAQASATEELRAFMEASHTIQVCPRPVSSRFVLPDGTPLSVSFNGSQLIQNNKLWGIIVTIQDLTHIFELHQREKHLLENYSRLQQEQAESLLQFALAVSHQIRNPIMSIAGFSRRLQDMVQAVQSQPLLNSPLDHSANITENGTNSGEFPRPAATPQPAPQTTQQTNGLAQHKSVPCNNLTDTPEITQKLDDYADIILEGAQRLESIVGAVSGFTSLTPRERMEASVCELLNKIGERERDKHRDVSTCSLSIACEPVQAELDVTLFSTALSALLDNAFYAAGNEHNDTNCKVKISAALEDGCLVVRVEDNGPGISESIRPFIFDPFYSTKPVGTGMGLCKAQRAVQLMNGELFIFSPPEDAVHVETSIEPQDIPSADLLQAHLPDAVKDSRSNVSALSTPIQQDDEHKHTAADETHSTVGRSIVGRSITDALRVDQPHEVNNADASDDTIPENEKQPRRCDVSFARAEALLTGSDNSVAKFGTAAILRIPVSLGSKPDNPS